MVQDQAAPETIREQDAQTPEDAVSRQEDDVRALNKKIRSSEKSVKTYQSFMLRLVLFIIVLWVLLFKIIGITHMPNGDMVPRLDAGDLLLFYRLDGHIRAQDVVVIEKVTPDSAGKKEMFVSRIIAAPGDTVEITDEGNLRVNGNAVAEPNIKTATPRYEGYTEFPLTLGDKEYFVLSDERTNGADSRYFGPVTKKEIQGTVITVLRRNNL